MLCAPRATGSSTANSSTRLDTTQLNSTRLDSNQLDFGRHEWVGGCIVVDLPLLCLIAVVSSTNSVRSAEVDFLDLTVLAVATKSVSRYATRYKDTGVPGYMDTRHPGLQSVAGSPLSASNGQEHGAPWTSWVTAVIGDPGSQACQANAKNWTYKLQVCVCVCSPSPVSTVYYCTRWSRHLFSLGQVPP